MQGQVDQRRSIYVLVRLLCRQILENAADSTGIEFVLAYESTVEFHNRNPQAVFLQPVRTRLDIDDLDRQAIPDEREQLFDELLAQVATGPAEYTKRSAQFISHRLHSSCRRIQA